MLRAWIAFAVTAGAIGVASAEPMSARQPHWGIGAGGYLSLTGSEARQRGSALTAEILPGGGFGRLGFRLEAFGLGRLAPDTGLAGLAFEAAASRPRLQIVLIATAGATTSGAPVGRVGVQTQLWTVGPIAVAADGGALLRVDGSDTELLIESALLLRLAR